MKNIFKNIKFIPLVCLLLVSCEDLDQSPEDRFTDSNYWTSPQKAQMMLNTAYSQMQNSEFFFYNEGLSDNAYNGRGDNAGAASIAAGLYDPSLARIKREWNDRYSGIKSCNILLENIDRVPNADPAVIARMKAEARFLRAFQHFQLTTWFGDIPLLQKDPTLIEATTVTRTSHAQVVQFILNEIDAIMPALQKNNEIIDDEGKGRITVGAAAALKARVLLYEGRWEDVVQVTQQFMAMNYGQYSLFPSYEGLFQQQNEFNSEDVLSLQYVPTNRTWGEFFDMAPLSVGARLNALSPTQELVDSYLMLNGKKINETGSGYNENNPYVNRDPRLTYTVVYDQYNWKDKDGSHTIYIKPGSSPTAAHPDEYAAGSSSTPTGYFTRKYYDVQHETDLKSSINLMLFRYADILLMYAEAKNELNQMNSTVWDQTIRALRSRAGFTDAGALAYNSALGQAGLKEVIRNERRVEFGMEGLRIFDIRRWKIAEDVLNGYAHGAKFGISSIDNGYLRVNLRTFDPEKHYLWPIPRDERLINTNLSQNPNW